MSSAVTIVTDDGASVVGCTRRDAPNTRSTRTLIRSSRLRSDRSSVVWAQRRSGPAPRAGDGREPADCQPLHDGSMAQPGHTWPLVRLAGSFWVARSATTRRSASSFRRCQAGMASARQASPFRDRLRAPVAASVTGPAARLLAAAFQPVSRRAHFGGVAAARWRRRSLSTSGCAVLNEQVDDFPKQLVVALEAAQHVRAIERRLACRRLGRAPSGCTAAGPVDERVKLSRVDRLGQVVVHAGREALLAVARHRVRRHRDDAHVAAVLRSLARMTAGGLEPAHAGHLQVHEDEVEGLARQRLERLLPVSTTVVRWPRFASRATASRWLTGLSSATSTFCGRPGGRSRALDRAAPSCVRRPRRG